MNLTDGLSRLFSPLRTLRVPVDDFITIAHISLRFIPTLFTQAHRIALAQKARGLDFKVPLIRRIRYTIPLIVPIILLSIKRAHELGLALESRWYDPGRKRTSFIELRLRKLDYSVLTIVLILIGGTQLCAILNF
jgi:energy-coupling factor transport system permease protein